MFAAHKIFMKTFIGKYWVILCCVFAIVIIVGSTSCANMIPPTGGPIDSLPPRLVTATPKDSATNFTGNRITLTFDEYVELQSAFENVLVSPTPKIQPNIDYKLRNVTIKLRDTLEANTTYSINFGKAIKDVNEGNVFKDFTYVFSTGPTIDSNMLSGKVTMAATGKIDTTLLAVLYRNLDDSAVAKEKPRFITRIDNKGMFTFQNLPVGKFNLFVIPNEFSKRYDDTTKPFAFANEVINTATDNEPVILYAYQLPKIEVPKPPVSRAPSPADKNRKLSYSINLDNGQQDLLSEMVIQFKQPVKYDSTKVHLLNADLKPLASFRLVPDSNNQIYTAKYTWLKEQDYNLVFDKSAFEDSSGLTLTKNDTILFATKRESDYGSVKLRFNNLDTSLHPVLLLIQNDKIIEASPLTQRDWYRKLFYPGEYDIRILYDTNRNGKWDPGNYFGKKRQPEIVRDLNIKLSIRGNWDNEKEIGL